MAKKYALTEEFSAITETKGTVQNVGIEAVELVSTSHAVAGDGIVLMPGDQKSFSGALSARSLGSGGATLNVVDFTDAAGGGDSANIQTLTAADIVNGTDTTGKLISAKVLADYVSSGLADLVASAPAALDTLKEIAAAIGDDPNFATTIMLEIGKKLDKTAKAKSAETADSVEWADVQNKQVATESAAGLMSAADKIKIDNLVHSAAAHNGIFRGKDLTSYFDSGQMSTDIANGKFDDIYIGDYITKTVSTPETTYTDKAGTEITQAAATYNNVKWLVAGINSHWNSGTYWDTIAINHLLLISDSALQRNVSMNPTDDTTGGYLGSDMWTVHMPIYANAIKMAFGANHVLHHHERLTNAISPSAPSACGTAFTGTSIGSVFTDVDVNIPNETMVYGGSVFNSGGHDVGDFPQQLPLFTFKQYIGGDDRSWFWLRTVSSSTHFSVASGNGDASCVVASANDQNGGIRPYFLLY